MAQTIDRVGFLLGADGPVASLILRRGELIAGAFLCIGVGLAVWIQTEFNAGYIWAAKFLSLPWAVLIAATAWAWRKHLVAEHRPRWGRIVEIMSWYLMIILASGGYVAALNAWLPPQRNVQLAGTVLRIGRTGDGTANDVGIRRVLDVRLDDGERVVRVPAGEDADARFKIGDRVQLNMRQGSLGIYYFSMVVWRGADVIT
jgi:hypothetical protein